MGVHVLLASGDLEQYDDGEKTTYDFDILSGGVLVVTITQSLSELISAEETTGYRTYSPNAWVKAWRT